MIMKDKFKDKFPPKRLAFWCTIAAALWFLLIYPLFLLAAPGKLPSRLAPSTFPDLPVDTPQWYLGASTVLSGDWQNLYPEINPEVFTNPNAFQPLIMTPLFDAESAAANPAFVPMFSVRTQLFLSHFYRTPWLSRYPADFWLQQHPRMQNSCFNYIYPPPTALVMAPLAFFSLENMALKLWPILASFAMFGLAVCSGKIFRLLIGRETYAECLLILVLLFTPWGDEFNCGNVSPLLSFFLAWGVLAWLKARPVQTGTSMIFPLLTKGIPLFWLPLLLLERKIRWKTIIVLGAWTLLLNIAVLVVAGWTNAFQAYRYYFTAILPYFTPVVGYDYITRIAEYYGFYPGTLYAALKYLLLIALYYGFWRGCRNPNRSDDKLRLVAVMGGTMCVFLTFSRLHWHHYFPFLFYFPFLGWMILEAMSGRKMAYAAILLGIPAIFTLQLEGWNHWNSIEEAFAAPLLAIDPNIAIWKYFLPRLRTLAILAGLLLAFQRLYPAKYSWPVKTFRTALAVAGCLCLVYLAVGFGIRHHGAALAEHPATVAKAARLGNLKAIREVAITNETSNPEAAAAGFRLASIRGDAESFYRLGRMYESGIGVPRDEGNAWRCYLQAVFSGKSEAWPEASRLFPHLEGLARP